jgi:beta-glucanase (GH16 family)
MRLNILNIAALILWATIGCAPEKKEHHVGIEEPVTPTKVVVRGTDYLESIGEDLESPTTLTADTWLSYQIDFPEAGRYTTEVVTSYNEAATIWIEDYFDNPDGRTYDVTGNMVIGKDGLASVDGSPFNSGAHKIKVHARSGEATIKEISFTLIAPHQTTPKLLEQNMQGTEWELTWSDEFEGTEIDTSNWNFDLGDWGWGNNELQYYTNNNPKNARLVDGNLVIEAIKNDHNEKWTSARLTTRGKASFLYGKIEFKAQVPSGKGNWAAAWTLGDDYVDEISWPYCGEIDILESVGYEVNKDTGDGIAHATVHTPAYYFKINNQISSTREVKNISGEFHTYAVEWTPREIRAFVDDEQYYVYDKTANELEWPFNKPQNIILNLAMGGGWGGAQGMDPTITSQKFLIDYVRVYTKK